MCHQVAPYEPPSSFRQLSALEVAPWKQGPRDEDVIQLASEVPTTAAPLQAELFSALFWADIWTCATLLCKPSGQSKRHVVDQPRLLAAPECQLPRLVQPLREPELHTCIWRCCPLSMWRLHRFARTPVSAGYQTASAEEPPLARATTIAQPFVNTFRQTSARQGIGS